MIHLYGKFWQKPEKWRAGCCMFSQSPDIHTIRPRKMNWLIIDWNVVGTDDYELINPDKFTTFHF